MGVPFQVTFESLWPSDEVMDLVRQRVDDLQTTYGDIDQCHVIVERPRTRRGKGRKFRVSVNVTICESEESADATASSEHPRLQTALSNAFHSIWPRVGALPSRCRVRTAASSGRDQARSTLRKAA